MSRIAGQIKSQSFRLKRIPRQAIPISHFGARPRETRVCQAIGKDAYTSMSRFAWGNWAIKGDTWLTIMATRLPIAGWNRSEGSNDLLRLRVIAEKLAIRVLFASLWLRTNYVKKWHVLVTARRPGSRIRAGTGIGSATRGFQRRSPIPRLSGRRRGNARSKAGPPGTF